MVSFRYREELKPVFNELDFEIPIGKKIAFVGASGGGKSTIDNRAQGARQS